jgi:hypothetical protein
LTSFDESHLEYYGQYVGSKFEFYYKNEWKSESIISWNISAFLFGIFWWFYRKMYVEAVIILIILFSSDILFPIFNVDIETGFKIDILLGVAFALFSGIFGNIVYLKHTERNISRLLKNNNIGDLKIRESTSALSLIIPALFLIIIITISII